MDFFSLDSLWSALWLALMFLMLGLHVFGLPGNWAILGLALLWKWMVPAMPAGVWFFAGLGGLALVGEVLEFFVQHHGGKRYGGTPKGNIGALIGAVAGSILGAPFFFGLGALPGAVLGAYGGSLLTERLHGRTLEESHRAAMGNMFGKVLGMVLKAGLGVAMFVMSAPRIWPD